MSCPVRVLPHHVGIFTSDIDRAIAWWEEMLGAEKMRDQEHHLPDYGNARIAWMRLGNFYIELYDFPGLADGNASYWKTYGTKHLSVCVADEDFEPLAAYLEEKGVEVIVRANHPTEVTGKPGDAKVLFVNDPDGNRVEIQQAYTPGEY